jgi:hypothetical protein
VINYTLDSDKREAGSLLMREYEKAEAELLKARAELVKQVGQFLKCTLNQLDKIFRMLDGWI